MQFNTFNLDQRTKTQTITAIKGYMAGEPPLMAKWASDAPNTNKASFDALEAIAIDLRDNQVLTPENLDKWVEAQEQRAAFEVFMAYLKSDKPLNEPSSPEENPEVYYKYRGFKNAARILKRNDSFDITSVTLDSMSQYSTLARKYRYTETQ